MSSGIPWGTHPDTALFTISVAAELTGLHAQTLRGYEREGLIEPARSAGGTRRYSTREIDRLREIAALVATGLNIAGVRRVLELQGQLRDLRDSARRVDELQREIHVLKALVGRQARESGRR